SLSLSLTVRHTHTFIDSVTPSCDLSSSPAPSIPSLHPSLFLPPDPRRTTSSRENHLHRTKSKSDKEKSDSSKISRKSGASTPTDSRKWSSGSSSPQTSSSTPSPDPIPAAS